MRIADIRLDTALERPRISALVEWEDSERPSQTIFFETDKAFADGLAAEPEPFLAACLTPALWGAERRVVLDGEVCPVMLDNLRVVTGLFHHWYGQRQQATVIEAKPRSRPIQPARPQRAGFFFSGGLDSLASLRSNRATFSPAHPGWFKDGVIIFGLEVEKEEPFRYVMEALAELATEAEITLLPVATNIRSLNPDWVFWWHGYMGAALSAVAHALGQRWNNVTVASDYDIPHLRAHGSHPLIETNFSSHDLKMRYDGITLTRLQKARLVSQWPPALKHLRVCNKPQDYGRGRLNCGACEKCIRTMLELLVCGVLDQSEAFAQRDLSPQLVLEKAYVSTSLQPYYEELVGPLAEVGRPDLADAVKTLLARGSGELGWAGRLRKLDRVYLNGGLLSLKRAFIPERGAASKAKTATWFCAAFILHAVVTQASAQPAACQRRPAAVRSLRPVQRVNTVSFTRRD